jgi:hypothetical protein
MKKAIILFFILVLPISVNAGWTTDYECGFDDTSGDCNGWSSCTVDTANSWCDTTSSWGHIRNSNWDYTGSPEYELVNISGELSLASGHQYFKFNFYTTTGTSSGTQWIWDGSGTWGLKEEGTTTSNYNTNLLSFPTATMEKFWILHNRTSKNTMVCYSSAGCSGWEDGVNDGLGGDQGYFSMQIGSNGGELRLGSLKVEHWTAGEGGPADTTPPEITYFNLTSGSGCENWNTDKTNACSTSDVNPTVQFNTNENAWCAIGGGNPGILDKNYTDLGSSRYCTTGEGTTEHFCTLTSQDEVVYDTSYLYVSCKDADNNQNSSSTSDALKVSVTGLETNARNSIGLGIQNALLSDYTNYTTQQVSARSLSNNQFLGTFDWMVKKASKVWIFNYISSTDSHVANTFNLTPSVYVLQLTNATQSQITLLVEQTINATN